MSDVDVAQLAKLARIAVPAHEAPALAAQLEATLQAFALVDPGPSTAEDEPVAFREDVAGDDRPVEAAAIRAAFPRTTKDGLLDAGLNR